MAATPQRALIVIDLQNDYFPDGKFPLWNTEAVLAQVESAIARARGQGVPVILVQHIADAPNGAAPFFNAGTSGVELHPRILAAAPDAVVVTKAQLTGSRIKSGYRSGRSQHYPDSLFLKFQQCA